MPIRYRSCLLAVLAACAAAPAASAQAPARYVFSERVGAAIEPEERDYFGLFPGVEGFERATAYTAPGDSVRVVIERPAADSTLAMPRATAQALGRFIESFEQHGTAYYNPDWQVVRSYVQVDVPVPSVQGHGTVVVYVEDGYYAGHPFYASDSVLVLSRRPRRDWRAFAGEGSVILASEVEEVRVYGGAAGFYSSIIASNYAPLLGLPAGLLFNQVFLGGGPEGSSAERRLVAASVGAMLFSVLRLSRSKWRPYDEALRDLEGRAWFTADARPLELPADGELERRAAERPAPRPRWRSSLGWFDTGAGVVLAPPATQHYTFYSNFVGEDAEREVEISSGGAMEAALALRPLGWLNVGCGVYVAPTPEVGANDLQEVAYSKPSFRAFAEVDLVRLVWSDSPIGVALGGGLLMAESAVSQRFPENWATTYSPEGYDLSERGFRPFYSATLEVGVLSQIALFGRLLSWRAPSVDVPLTEVQSVAFPGTVVYRVEPHTVDFGQMGFAVGLRTGF